MEMTLEEYFFYEWLILSKALTQEEFNNLSIDKFNEYVREYREFTINLK